MGLGAAEHHDESFGAASLASFRSAIGFVRRGEFGLVSRRVGSGLPLRRWCVCEDWTHPTSYKQDITLPVYQA